MIIRIGIDLDWDVPDQPTDTFVQPAAQARIWALGQTGLCVSLAMPSAIPSKILDPLHLYRHLLRESSYLPRICQPYVHSQIKEQFRTTGDKIRRFEQTAPETASQRAQKALQQGNRELRRLRSSNTGHSLSLQRLLRHVFGRQGRRRRQLVSQFVHHDAPADSSTVQQQLDQADEMKRKKGAKRRKVTKLRVQEYWDTKKLSQFIATQRVQQKTTSPSSWNKPPTPGTDVNAGKAKETIWGTPIPERRISKRLEKWWITAVDRIMPPVQKTEWDMLSRAAYGNLPAEQWQTRPRRTIARSMQDHGQSGGDHEGHTQNWDWKARATMPTRYIERFKQDNAGPYWEPPQHAATKHRQLRREYLHIWETMSYAEQDPSTLKNTYRWGRRPNPPPATPRQAKWLFTGEAAERLNKRRFKSKRQLRAKYEEASAILPSSR